MKDNTVNTKAEKRAKWVIEQMFSDHKKPRHITNTHILKFKKKYYVFYSLTSQTDRQNIYWIVTYIWEECPYKKSVLYLN